MKIIRTKSNNTGVTLVELLVIVSIIGILAIALGFSYQGWMGNYRIESQTKQLYSDLMDARTRAMTRNRMHFVVLNTTDYSIYEDSNDNNVPNPGAGPSDDHPIPEYCVPGTFNVRPKIIQYNLGWTGTIPFNTRGLTTSAATITIPLTLPSGAKPDYDCIRVHQSKIRTGQMTGGVCVDK